MPRTRATYSFSTVRPANCRASARWVSSSLATTRRPEVPRSRRWTMPGRSTPPTPGEVAHVAEQGVDQRPAAACPRPGARRGRPACSRPARCASSKTTSSGMSSGSRRRRAPAAGRGRRRPGRAAGGPRRRRGPSLEAHVAGLDQRLEARARRDRGACRRARRRGALARHPRRPAGRGRSPRAVRPRGSRTAPAAQAAAGAGGGLAAEPRPEGGRAEHQDDGDHLGRAERRRRTAMPRPGRRARTPGRSGSPSSRSRR